MLENISNQFSYTKRKKLMKTKSIFIAVALLVMNTLTVSHAQTSSLKSLDGWTLLGTRTVDYTLDRDVVTLEEGKDTYTSLKFVVKNGTLNMRKATVHFASGEDQNIDFPSELNKVNDGRKIDLLGNSRYINKVTFWYDTKMDSKNKSIVELWGMK
jgi:hypothetical protein